MNKNDRHGKTNVIHNNGFDRIPFSFVLPVSARLTALTRHRFKSIWKRKILANSTSLIKISKYVFYITVFLIFM
jgi:hypothetical protein